MKDKYQKCIEKIVVEENQWKNKGGNSQQVSIYFKPRVFRYCPSYCEVRKVVDCLVEIYGKEKVEKEMKIRI